MKYCLSLLLLVTAFIANAQTKPAAHKNDPVYFLNTTKYNKLPVMDPGTIQTITVIKDQPAQFPDGAVYIQSKDDVQYHFISLEQVAQKYIGNAKPFMAMIDNEFITDMANVVIDSAFILKCDTLSTKDFVHLQHMPEMMILKITTATKENIEKSKRIIIRG